MSIAPHPVLGLDSTASNGRWRRHQVVSRVALALAIVSVLFALFVLLAFIGDVWRSPYFDRFRFASYGCLLMGLIVGAYSRRTRTGKVALFLSLVSATLAAVVIVMLANFFAHNTMYDSKTGERVKPRWDMLLLIGRGRG